MLIPAVPTVAEVHVAEIHTPAAARLVCRRHVDLLRVSSALCRR